VLEKRFFSSARTAIKPEARQPKRGRGGSRGERGGQTTISAGVLELLVEQGGRSIKFCFTREDFEKGGGRNVLLLRINLTRLPES